MSLATVLSTMRVLILDRPELPASYEERLKFFHNGFPGLEETEIEDLAKIEPEKMRLYTQTIFAGERSVLRNHFPITFSLIKAKFDPQIDFFKLVQDLHIKRPWKSYLTSGLTNGFVDYLKHDRLDILKKIPEIVEIATMENLSLSVSRIVSKETENSLKLDNLINLTVSELLALNCNLLNSIALQTFSYDTISYRREFLENEKELPAEDIKKKDIFAVCSRDKWHNVCWNDLSKSVFEFLKNNQKNSFTLGSLATAYLEGEDDSSRNEQELFQDFMKLFSTFVDDGVLVIISE